MIRVRTPDGSSFSFPDATPEAEMQSALDAHFRQQASQLDYARIKRNISKMIAQNAPEADIDAYAQSEGTTPEALRAFGQQAETHILRDDSSPPLNDIFRLRKGGRPILDFADGTCSLLGWRDGNGQSLRNIAR